LDAPTPAAASSSVAGVVLVGGDDAASPVRAEGDEPMNDTGGKRIRQVKVRRTSPPVRDIEAGPTKPTLTTRQRVLSFVVLCLVCVAGSAGYTIHAANRKSGNVAAASPFAPPPAVIAAQPHVVFLDTSSAKTFLRVGFEALGSPEERTLTGLTCVRVYAAAGNGICLSDDDSILLRA
jgi:hypothetical protein